MPPRDPSTTASMSALRVLVIDDNVDGAEALSDVLAAMGCTPAVAHDGAQGLALAAIFDPHLALIDLDMPDMNGCDVARRLKALPALNRPRLVCLTGRGLPEDRRQCLEAGFDAFFTKPIVLGSLVDELEAAKAADRWPQAARTSSEG